MCVPANRKRCVLVDSSLEDPAAIAYHEQFPMGTDNGPVCPEHTPEVRMMLRTLHSDQSVPDQVLGVYACPECDHERRVPIDTSRRDGGSGSLREGHA